MEKIIDVIIPSYKGGNCIDRLLASIQSQVNADQIKVTIVSDGDNYDYQSHADRFKHLDIQVLSYPENQGCGYARQYGLDHTECPYVMFADADDILYSSFSVKKLQSKLVDNISVVYSRIIQYNNQEELTIDVFHWIWLHGMMIKRSFINNHNIQFYHNSAGEDVGFNAQIRLFDTPVESIEFLSEPTYVWTDFNNEGRINTNYFGMFSSKKGVIDNLTWVYERNKDIIGKKFLAEEMINDMVSFYLNYQLVQIEGYEEYEDMIDWIKPFYNKFHTFFDDYDRDVIRDLIYKHTLNLPNRSNFKYLLSWEDFIAKFQ